MDENIYVITLITDNKEELNFHVEGFELVCDFINVCAINGYFVKCDKVEK